ncbi:hypothetical protein [Algoriphagus aquimarinus]|uniref:hypothetical protein n=1 Tax=Algoriphagus aquimarinus TaxID=237018 RepID=UPI0030D86EF8|tara:strand:+ start:147283 stop:147549 length:267 start_codon:yes stop_codon:yes gene_type:complete
MKKLNEKLLLVCLLFSGFAVTNTTAAETLMGDSKITETRLCPPEDNVFITFETSCGETAVASGCTTEEIVADVIQWEEFYCGPMVGPV